MLDIFNSFTHSFSSAEIVTFNKQLIFILLFLCRDSEYSKLFLAILLPIAPINHDLLDVEISVGRQ